MNPRPGRSRVFLLSPAFSGGKRAQMLLSERAQFELARKLRAGEAALGELFAFMSGLYFRGKLAYARAFAAPPPGLEVEGAVLVITAGEGLVRADAPVALERLRAFEAVPVDAREPAYRRPLARDARALSKRLGDGEAVLLGSIATGKYLDPLLETLGPRLVFPKDFVGRGDMSRGGLMLRCVDEGRELEYVPVTGAVRHGVRPPKLPPRERKAQAEAGGDPLRFSARGAGGQPLGPDRARDAPCSPSRLNRTRARG